MTSCDNIRFAFCDKRFWALTLRIFTVRAPNLLSSLTAHSTPHQMPFVTIPFVQNSFRNLAFA